MPISAQLTSLDIHLPETARRPKIAGVAAPSTVNSKHFVRFTLSCVAVRVMQSWGLFKVKLALKAAKLTTLIFLCVISHITL